jgi:tetratricopeptide (TPR) repeat protein
MAVGAYALSLMSKQMGVTLPFVLLLLDYWPLGRTRWARPTIGDAAKRTPGNLLKEKLPFFALAAASSVVAYWVQHRAGAINAFEGLPLGLRFGNAVLSYVGYIGKTLWPTRLSIFYPLPTQLPVASVTLAALAMLTLTLLVIWRAHRQPWLITGWFWYVGTLVPVIGLVQIGAQAMADRYTYLPSVGLLMMLCWSVPERTTTALTVAAAIATSGALTRIQLGHWKDSETLFRHALSVTRDNWQAHFNLGVALNEGGRNDDAIMEYKRALQIRPLYVEARNNLGAALWRAGEKEVAITHWREAIRIKPDAAEAHRNLGLALRQQGRMEDAVDHYRQALRTQPEDAETHNGLGSALMRLDRVPEAIEQFEHAVQIKPAYAEAHNNLGAALVKAGQTARAVEQFEHALRIRPDYALAHYNLGAALEQAGNVPQAIMQYSEALRLDTGLLEARKDLMRLQSIQRER